MREYILTHKNGEVLHTFTASNAISAIFYVSFWMHENGSQYDLRDLCITQNPEFCE